MPEHKAHPLNVEGDFYVENRCCITCDLPRSLAPDMFKYTDEKDHCYVYKQPETADQLERMIQAVEGAEVACVRCRTRDKALLQKLQSRNQAEQCDALENETPPKRHRKSQNLWLDVATLGSAIVCCYAVAGLAIYFVWSRVDAGMERMWTIKWNFYLPVLIASLVVGIPLWFIFVRDRIRNKKNP